MVRIFAPESNGIYSKRRPTTHSNGLAISQSFILNVERYAATDYCGHLNNVILLAPDIHILGGHDAKEH
jgi:hypothetical protein